MISVNHIMNIRLNMVYLLIRSFFLSFFVFSEGKYYRYNSGLIEKEKDKKKLFGHNLIKYVYDE